ncbi:16S rRNA (guanine(527)-N(7))-methyltransferase RsmG [Agrilactobacillus fermenti]|uniref:16S rRNA (guanine(527)-N(7))-methyltransferase RsmG n=1 Tax=Agrilactobacillus fermenti TaxID=2586909 RepID=UPI003A5C38C4
MSPETFRTILAQQFQIEVSDTQLQQFETYFNFLTTQNKVVNLTAITEKEAVYLKHFFDSVTPLLYLPELFTSNSRICDIGAGAGFPSLPLKILRPDLKITIIDSLNKRINFLGELVAQLNLSQVTLKHGRAEDFARKGQPLRESFDLVLSRAVAQLPILSEFCLPYVQPEGYFLALKGRQGADELTKSRFAIATLGGKYIKTKSFTLPDSDEARDIIVIQKRKQTPNRYPRKAGMPAKQPLIQ